MSQTTALNELNELLEIMARLRSPEGCPWDRQQTPESLKQYVLEEAYEVIEAIDHARPDEICDELGDLLLQVVFQAQIFSERGQFGMAEVAGAISAKLRRRHPHIFSADPVARQDRDWERIKLAERSQRGQSLQLAGRIPSALPALKRAVKLLDKLAREQEPPPDPAVLWQEAEQALHELRCGSATEDAEQLIGRLLYASTALSRSLGVDAEEALRRTTDRRIDEHDQQAAARPRT